MHALTTATVASIALLSSLFSGVVAQPAQPAGIAQTPQLKEYEALLLSKIKAESLLVGPAELDESRRPGGWNLRNHGHKHAHTQEDWKPSPTPTPTDETETRATKVKRANIAAPVVSAATYLGVTTNNPSQYYFYPQSSGTLPDLTSANLLNVNLTVETPLAQNYPMFAGTGTLTLTTANQNQLYKLSTKPSISRDAGKGGYLNGSKLFIFSDSESFTDPASNGGSGAFTGFVSTSVACDFGFNAADGMTPALRDRVGTWVGNNGGLRGFVPMTSGEQSYNFAMSGKGGRIAIWPSSSITNLYNGVAIQYAPIILVDSTNGVNFHQVGATAYTISIPNQRSGPVANRIAPLLFPATAQCWGCMGGLRSWGADGVGGTQGWLYIFANNNNGLLLARVPPTQAATLSAYQYYWPSTKSWNGTETTQVFLSGSYSASDIFYSPMHKTFINVYADRYIDNLIIWRYLIVPAGGISPTYDGSDFASAIYSYSWSNEQTLFHAPTPGNGLYIYGSGPNMGYFEDDDIVNGGNKMLLTWTAPTGKGASSAATGYAIPAAVVTWA